MGEKRITRELLYQHWVHSHEEDTDTETVYRPATFDFPLSRGRSGFKLGSDYSCIDFGIAATDGTQESWGTWEIDDDGNLTLFDEVRSPRRVMRVASIAADRLVVKK